MPTTHSKTAVVTGAVTGLGASLALQLAAAGWNLVLLNRNRTTSEDLLAQLSRKSPSATVDVIEVDLSDHRSIHAAVAQLIDKHPRIDALFNNAGVLLGDQTTSPPGNEMHFEVNTLAPYQLMRLLRPALKAGGNSVVVNVSANIMEHAGRLRVEDLKQPRSSAR